MALEMKVALKMTQQLVMTPQLQQAIKLLQLNHIELSNEISEQMVENPALEESPVDPQTDEERAANEPPEPPESPEPGEVTDPRGESIDWERFLDDQFQPTPRGTMGPTIADDLPPPETNLTRTDTLSDHLIWQLQMADVTRELAQVAGQIIGNLEDDGYLKVPLDEIAISAGVDLERAEEALDCVQRLDPLGVASRDLRECLLTQARVLHPEDRMLWELICNHLGDLEKRNYQGIARTLGVGLPKIAELVRVIQEMEPRPGRPFSGGDAQYITPDVYVRKIGDEYIIQLNEDGLPRLRVSPYVRTVYKKAGKAEELTKARELAKQAGADCPDGKDPFATYGDVKPPK